MFKRYEEDKDVYRLMESLRVSSDGADKEDGEADDDDDEEEDGDEGVYDDEDDDDEVNMSHIAGLNACTIILVI